MRIGLVESMSLLRANGRGGDLADAEFAVFNDILVSSFSSQTRFLGEKYADEWEPGRKFAGLANDSKFLSGLKEIQQHLSTEDGREDYPFLGHVIMVAIKDKHPKIVIPQNW